MTDLSNLVNLGDAIRRVGSPVAPNMSLPDLKLPKVPNMAAYAVEAIYEEIADFEATLDEDHEVGMPVVGGPAGLCVHVRKVYRRGTDKLIFVGMDSSQKPVRLIQHLSQLNLLMLAAPKLGEIAVRIGFHKPEE